MGLDTLSLDWSASSSGWNGFTFGTPWFYDGSGNLIIEFRYYGNTGTTVNVRAMNLPSCDRCLDAGYPDSSTGSYMSFLTCLRVQYTPTGVEGGAPDQGQPLTLPVNPVRGSLTVLLDLADSGPVTLDIYSMAGQLLDVLTRGIWRRDATACSSILQADHPGSTWLCPEPEGPSRGEHASRSSNDGRCRTSSQMR